VSEKVNMNTILQLLTLYTNSAVLWMTLVCALQIYLLTYFLTFSSE